MLVFLRHSLAFLATPKTGTTAVEMALRSEAELIFAKNRKHITAARYQRRIAPFLHETFNVRPVSVAVMRHPVDQIGSWYRYRTSERLKGTDLSTHNIPFDDYVQDVISASPSPRAQIGSQFNFLTDRAGKVMSDHIFAYEAQSDFIAFLSERLGQPVTLDVRNASPKLETRIGQQALNDLRHARAAEFDLYDKIIANGGHLTSLPT